jgi:hypothetical protein
VLSAGVFDEEISQPARPQTGGMVAGFNSTAIRTDGWLRKVAALTVPSAGYRQW